MKVEWIDYKNKKILYADHRGAKNEEDMLKVLYEEVELEKMSDKKVPLLINYENTFITTKYMDEAKRLGKEVSNDKVTKTALVGINPIKKVFVNAYMDFTGDSNVKSFSNEEEAMEWLLN